MCQFVQDKDILHNIDRDNKTTTDLLTSF